MKKLYRIFTVVLCAFVALFAAACSGAPKHETGGGEYVISRETLEDKLNDFVSNNPDRSSYTNAEWQAAQYLQELLISYGYIDAEIGEFSVSGDASTLTSQNVQAVYGGGHEKNVIIGAYYDNAYTTQSSTGATVEIGTHGALSNGTGVATVLAVAEYLIENDVKLDFDVTFVFFGASAVSVSGAEQYYKGMTDEKRDATVLMIELQRIGVDHVYAFSDARGSKREELFERVAAENKLDIYSVSQKSPAITSAYAIDGVPFFQWAHSGLFPVFGAGGIPTLNLVGANWETMDLSDIESASADNISLTRDDTLDKLSSLYPDHSKKMAEAATLVVKSLTDGEFLSVMQYDVDHYPQTDYLTQRWIWYIVALAIILVALGVTLLVSSILGKKYPQVARQPKNLKVAVFGMDYEDKDPNNVYLDIKKSRDASIFPGVPDNDPFPQYSSDNRQAPPERELDIDPFEHAVIKAVYEDEKREEKASGPEQKKADKSSDEPEQKSTDKSSDEPEHKPTDKKPDEPEQKKAEDNSKKEKTEADRPKLEKKPTTRKRPTVSAGASTHKPTGGAKKSEPEKDVAPEDKKENKED